MEGQLWRFGLVLNVAAVKERTGGNNTSTYVNPFKTHTLTVRKAVAEMMMTTGQDDDQGCMLYFIH